MPLFLQIGPWHSADEYDGQVREITFRTICNSPMCPPDSAMTEYQHAILSPDKKMLVSNHFFCHLVYWFLLCYNNLYYINYHFLSFSFLRLYNRPMMSHLDHALRYCWVCSSAHIRFPVFVLSIQWWSLQMTPHAMYHCLSAVGSPLVYL